MISQLTPLVAREIHESRLAAAAAHRAPHNRARRHLRTRLARLRRRILRPAGPAQNRAGA